MTHKCPTCGRKMKSQPMQRIEREGDPEAWRAWIAALGAEKKIFHIKHWQSKGYMFQPSRFPPSYKPTESAPTLETEGASSHD